MNRKPKQQGISLDQLRYEVGAPAFVAARFALLLSLLSLVVSAAALAVAFR